MEGVERRMKQMIISNERKKYIKEKRKRNNLIRLTQIAILVTLALKGIIPFWFLVIVFIKEFLIHLKKS